MYEQLSTLTDYQMCKIIHVGFKVDENEYVILQNIYRKHFNFPCYLYDKATKTSTVKEMFKGKCVTMFVVG